MHETYRLQYLLQATALVKAAAQLRVEECSLAFFRAVRAAEESMELAKNEILAGRNWYSLYPFSLVRF